MPTLTEYLMEKQPLPRWKVLVVGLVGIIFGAILSYLYSILALLS